MNDFDAEREISPKLLPGAVPSSEDDDERKKKKVAKEKLKLKRGSLKAGVSLEQVVHSDHH